MDSTKITREEHQAVSREFFRGLQEIITEHIDKGLDSEAIVGHLMAAVVLYLVAATDAVKAAKKEKSQDDPTTN